MILDNAASSPTLTAVGQDPNPRSRWQPLQWTAGPRSRVSVARVKGRRNMSAGMDPAAYEAALASALGQNKGLNLGPYFLGSVLRRLTRSRCLGIPNHVGRKLTAQVPDGHSPVGHHDQPVPSVESSTPPRAAACPGRGRKYSLRHDMKHG